MKGSFLVVASTTGRPISGATLDLLDKACLPKNQESIDGRHLLVSPERTFGIAVSGVTHHAQWDATSPSNVVWSLGDFWHCDQRSLATTQAIGELASQPLSIAPEWLATRLRGIFIGGAVLDSNRCHIYADPLGFRCVYYGTADGLTGASSSCNLLAAALGTSVDLTPEGILGTVALAYCGHRIGDRTGFEHIRTLAPGGVLTLGVNEKARMAAQYDPIAAGARESVDPGPALDRAEQALRQSILQAAEIPTTDRQFGLTGGKDSRLLLAAAIAEGVTDAFTFFTNGPQQLADVVVASALAERFHLHYRAGYGVVEQPRYDDQVREFLNATSGLLNVADSRPLGAPEYRKVEVTGLGGEMLRSFRHLHPRIQTIDQLVGLYQSGRIYGTLSLLTSEGAEAMEGRVHDLMLDDRPSDDPRATLDRFLIHHRLRYSRTGPLEEVLARRRLSPLYDAPTIREAFSIGSALRHEEFLHRELTARLSPELLDMPYAGPGFVHGAQPSKEAPSVPKAEPLVARLQRRAFNDRQSFLQSILAVRTSPAWRFLSQERCLAELERFPSLKGNARRELLGAVTAVLWLGGD